MSDPKKKPRTSVPRAGFTSTLARLASLAPRANKAEEDDEKKDDKASDDDADDEGRKSKKKGKARSKDRDDDDDVDPADDDDELDDEDDENDKVDKKASAARGRERGRIAAIINSRAAQRSDTHRAMAMSLALTTELTRSEAIVVLSQTPAPDLAKSGAQTARQRLNSAPNPDVGASDGGGDGKGPNLAAQIVAAGKKRRGETS